LEAPGAQWSAIGSPGTGDPASAGELVRLMLDAGQRCMDLNLEAVAARCDEEYAAYVRQWPGEHYRLLAGLVSLLQPSLVVEIGTFRGHSALSLLAGSQSVHVVTYDLLEWRSIAGTILTEDDFTDRLQQRIGDLGAPAFFADQAETLADADLIIVDGPKDGRWEAGFCQNLISTLTDRPRLIVFDDIRMLTMVQLWHDLPLPKVDATSVGHWSGTGFALTASGLY
jgi:predicted O-methyltransferase YrrM